MFDVLDDFVFLLLNNCIWVLNANVGFRERSRICIWVDFISFFQLKHKHKIKLGLSVFVSHITPRMFSFTLHHYHPAIVFHSLWFACQQQSGRSFFSRAVICSQMEA